MNKRQIENRISLIHQINSNVYNIEDKELLFLLKKTEKITIATYILTDFIPASEIINKKLKDNAHELLDSVCELMTYKNDRIRQIQKIKSTYIKLLTQYDLANLSGHISLMNTKILKEEIEAILRTLSELERGFEDEVAPDFKENYFNLDIRQKRHYKTKEKDSLTVDRKFVPLKDTKPYGSVFNVKSSMSVSELNNQRDEKIISIIKDKGEVSIKDISKNILDCSEKTIQRTLNKLISQGKVKKIGERRWARYSLI